ncbi:MAG: helix-turn-helix transcriptional regulator [Phycisphaerae bacterium]
MGGAQSGLCMEQKIGEAIEAAGSRLSGAARRNKAGSASRVQHARKNDSPSHPTGPHLAGRVLAGRPFVCVRPEITPGRDWRVSEYFGSTGQPAERGEFLISYCPFAAHLHMAFCLSRARDAGPFERRDHTLVHLFHRELAQLINSELSRVHRSTPLAQLPPRLRQTAVDIMSGKCEKEIASNLRLSRHTVHRHVQRLHRRFNASGRCELLSALLNQGTAPLPGIVL